MPDRGQLAAWLATAVSNAARVRAISASLVCQLDTDSRMARQVHLTRHCRRIVGLTPGRYARDAVT